jgi:outer membrane protein OmpA-like peptidoglycan-associated protein
MRRLPLLLLVCVLVGCLGACSLLGGNALGRKYVVFYTKDSASLDASAREVVAQAATAAADNPSMDVLVAGYAAAHGSLSADEALSGRRADIVADALRADGVAANRIHLSPRKPSNQDSVVGARRVEIDFSL